MFHVSTMLPFHPDDPQKVIFAKWFRVGQRSGMLRRYYIPRWAPTTCHTLLSTSTANFQSPETQSASTTRNGLAFGLFSHNLSYFRSGESRDFVAIFKLTICCSLRGSDTSEMIFVLLYLSKGTHHTCLLLSLLILIVCITTNNASCAKRPIVNLANRQTSTLQPNPPNSNNHEKWRPISSYHVEIWRVAHRLF